MKYEVGQQVRINTARIDKSLIGKIREIEKIDDYRVYLKDALYYWTIDNLEEEKTVLEIIRPEKIELKIKIPSGI